MKGQIKILYVEDEEALAKIVKETLENRGYYVTWVADGAGVEPLLQNFVPDICILDIMLPYKDGYSISHIIRKNFPKIPIIFLSAKVMTEDVLKGFKSGGNDYVKKPFSLEELLVRIENLLQLSRTRHTEDKEGIIALGKYSFNEKRGELILGDLVQKLSNREGQLLHYLYSHRLHAIDRRKLLKDLWGDDNLFNSRNLDVYILKLRQFLKEDDRIQIVTLKGTGYRFVC